jgi:hypothetical protein
MERSQSHQCAQVVFVREAGEPHLDSLPIISQCYRTAGVHHALGEKVRSDLDPCRSTGGDVARLMSGRGETTSKILLAISREHHLSLWRRVCLCALYCRCVVGEKTKPNAGAYKPCHGFLAG